MGSLTKRYVTIPPIIPIPPTTVEAYPQPYLDKRIPINAMLKAIPRFSEALLMLIIDPLYSGTWLIFNPFIAGELTPDTIAMTKPIVTAITVLLLPMRAMNITPINILVKVAAILFPIR